MRIIDQDISGTLGIRNKKWKFVPAARKTKLDPGDKFAVFEMENDWRETTNRIGDHPEVAEQLRELLKKQQKAGRTITPPESRARRATSG